MSAAETEAGGGSSQRHTREESEVLGSRGPKNPDGGDEEEEARGCGDAAAEARGGPFSGEEGGTSCKAQGMPSNSSSDTCIPTPSCRICFQGAEQVRCRPLTGDRCASWL